MVAKTDPALEPVTLYKITVDLYERMAEIGVLRRADHVDRDQHPGPADVFLIIEVADTSLAYDRRVKARLYAQNDIPELWIWDVSAEEVEVYRGPSPEGYQSVRRVQRGEALEPLELPGVRISIEELS